MVWINHFCNFTKFTIERDIKLQNGREKCHFIRNLSKMIVIISICLSITQGTVIENYAHSKTVTYY